MITRIKLDLLFFNSVIDYLFIGAIGTAILGEKILIECDVDNRPLPAILDKFSSDFITLPGDKITDKLEEMLDDDNIVSIKFTTRSLRTFYSVRANIEDNAKRMIEDNTKRMKIAPIN
jgi:hypothetical protein